MKFKIYKEFGALNSVPVFAALEEGIRKSGFSVVDNDQDVDVIWSVLWQGRMKNNQQVYERALQKNKPVMIVEVGNLLRGRTWRLSLGNINGSGIFANHENLDISRPEKLGVKLSPLVENRKNEILIACQHHNSLQWKGQPNMVNWAVQKIEEIRKFTSRPIVVRPHPRNQFSLNYAGVRVDIPRPIPNTYDDFNFDCNYHCVVNHNSGPAVKAAICGIPVITDVSSLAYPVSDIIQNIENPVLKDREEWFLKLTHTEWTLDEIASGHPVKNLISTLK
jgi:hypothetical protein